MSAFNVLIVDDEPFSRQVEGKLFQSLGIPEVVFAGGGAEAKSRIAADSSIRLIVSDHYMPDFSGLELLCELRQGKLGIAHDTFFMLATTSSSFALTAVALSMDVDCFLSKPFDRDLLARRLHGFMTGKRTIRSSDYYATIQVREMLDSVEPLDPASKRRHRPKPPPAVPLTPLRQVPDGTPLGDDLTAPDGTVILTKGVPVTRHIKDRLEELGIEMLPAGK